MVVSGVTTGTICSVEIVTPIQISVLMLISEETACPAVSEVYFKMGSVCLIQLPDLRIV